MVSWIECKTYGSKAERKMFVNLDQVVSLSGDARATGVRRAGGESRKFVVAGSPTDLLSTSWVGRAAK